MKKLDLFKPSALQPFVNCLDKRGVNANHYLEGNKIPPHAVESESGMIFKRQVYQFFKDVVHHEGIHTLGFLDGDPYPITKLGLISAALQRSVTLYDAIDTFSQLLSTVAEGNNVWLTEAREECWLCCHTMKLKRSDTVPDHTSVMALLEVIRLAAGENWKPEKIWFYTEPVREIRELPELTDTTFTFLKDFTGIPFPRHLLSIPLQKPLELQSAYDDFHDPQTSPETTYDKLIVVLETMQKHCRCLPSADQTAEMIGISRTTLFRTLEKEGANYRQALERVQYRTAQHMLSNESISIKEIAFELGYSAQGNFTRAFQRMSGVTPKQFRVKGEVILL